MDYLKHILTPRKVGYNKFRMGNSCDGGYVLFDINISQIERVYSYGIGNDVSFENDLAKRINENCIVYLYDHTIESIPELMNVHRMIWKKESASAKGLEEQMISNGDAEKYNMLLKMDVEGDEWKMLENIDPKILQRFSQIIIELHYVHEVNPHLLDKMANFFYLGHIHGNNNGNMRDGVPEVIECTYIRKDFFLNEPEIDNEKYPRPSIDFPNNLGKPDFQLDFWQKNTEYEIQ